MAVKLERLKLKVLRKRRRKSEISLTIALHIGARTLVVAALRCMC